MRLLLQSPSEMRRAHGSLWPFDLDPSLVDTHHCETPFPLPPSGPYTTAGRKKKTDTFLPSITTWATIEKYTHARTQIRMHRRTTVALGGAARAAAAGAKRPRSPPSLPSSSPSSSSSSSSSVTAVNPSSGPRTHLPFLLSVVKKAQSMPVTATAGTSLSAPPGPSSPFRAYPTLPAGATKHVDGSTVLYRDADCILVNDAFPKSTVHCLVMPLDMKLRSLNDLGYNKKKAAVAAAASSPSEKDARGGAVGSGHLQTLRHMDAVAQGYAGFLRAADPAAYSRSRFIAGFHALPSLPMLHLHLLSMDLDSPCLKTKKHYNSFATFFFITIDRVIEDLECNGRVTVNQGVAEMEKMENQPMACLWCGAAMPTVPAMKKHVPACPKNKAFNCPAAPTR